MSDIVAFIMDVVAWIAAIIVLLIILTICFVAVPIKPSGSLTAAFAILVPGVV